MIKPVGLHIVFLVAVVATLLVPARAVEAQAIVEPPKGFSKILAADGVQLYKKDYAKGNPDYVQVADLRQGARLKLLHGDIAKPGDGRGVYGGDNPFFKRLSLESFWGKISYRDSRAFCVATGGFFYLPDSPSRLAFPLKVNGQVLTDGYGIKEYPEQKLMLEIWDDHLDISPLTPDALYNSSAPDILAGLSENANKKAKFAVGRTFVGIADQDGNGILETALVFSTLTARQSDAADVLRSFGASKVMMLDGGGSTQLICENQSFVDSDRLIPQALAVMAGSSTVPLEQVERAQTPQVNEQNAEQVALQEQASTVDLETATTSNNLMWQVMVQGQLEKLELRLGNSTNEPWLAGSDALRVDKGYLGESERFPLPQAVQPGETLIFRWTTTPNLPWGVYATRWYIVRGEEPRMEGNLTLNLVVMPPELAAQQVELQGQVDAWVSAEAGDIEGRIQGWVRERSTMLEPPSGLAAQPNLEAADGEQPVSDQANVSGQLPVSDDRNQEIENAPTDAALQAVKTNQLSVVSLDDIFLVPLFMLPVALVVLIIAIKVQRQSQFQPAYNYTQSYSVKNQPWMPVQRAEEQQPPESFVEEYVDDEWA